MPVKVREWIGPALASPDLVLDAQRPAQPHSSVVVDRSIRFILFAIEREINGLAPQERLSVRRERSRPLIVELEAWLRLQRGKLCKNNDTTKGDQFLPQPLGCLHRLPQ